MLRVLLVLEDYNELVYLQTLLKKIGFDVDGIQSHRKLAESLLIMNPQLIIATAKSKQIDGLHIAHLLEQKNHPPKLLLIRHGSGGSEDDDSSLPPLVYGVIDSPVNPILLLELVAKAGNLDAAVLIDKFNKIQQLNDEDKTEPDEIELLQSQVDEFKAWVSGQPVPETPVPQPQKQDPSHAHSQGEGAAVSVEKRDSQQGAGQPQDPDAPAARATSLNSTDTASPPREAAKPASSSENATTVSGGGLATNSADSVRVSGHAGAEDSVAPNSSTRRADGPQEETQTVSGAGAPSMEEALGLNRPIIKPSSLTVQARRARFEKILAETKEPESEVFQPSQVHSFNKDLRRQENIDELKDLEEERRAFVRAMFDRNGNR